MSDAPLHPPLHAPLEESKVVDKAASSVVWSALTNLAPRLVTPLATLLLAALLTPKDFGIVAAAMVVISLAQIVVELGMGAAVIQSREDVDAVGSIALWASLFIASLLLAALWFCAPSIAGLMQIPELTAVLRISGLSLIFAAAMGVPKAILARRMEFRRLFWINFIPAVVIALASLCLAWLGLGYWALILGNLAGQLVNTILAWAMATWRPRFLLRGELFAPLFRFSSWVLVANFESWLFLYADNALVGFFLGASALGIYSLGFNLANLLPGMISATLTVVAFPAFSALQHDPAVVGSGLLKMHRLTSALMFPVCFGLSAIAVPAVSLLYGDRWPGLGIVIMLLAIMPGMSHLWSLNAAAYRAMGKPEIWTILAAISLLVMLPLLLWAGPYGLVYFVLARFIGALILPLFNILFGGPKIGLSVRQQMRPLAEPLGFSLLMYGMVLFLAYQMAPFSGVTGWLKLLVITLAGAMIYGLLLWGLSRDLWLQLLSSARRSLVQVRA